MKPAVRAFTADGLLLAGAVEADRLASGLSASFGVVASPAAGLVAERKVVLLQVHYNGVIIEGRVFKGENGGILSIVTKNKFDSGPLAGRTSRQAINHY